MTLDGKTYGHRYIDAAALVAVGLLLIAGAYVGWL